MAENRPGGFIDPKERMINALERIARALEDMAPLRFKEVNVPEPPVKQKRKK